MAQDKIQQARERYKDAVDVMRENWARMKEDLAFSNPTDPKQWPDDATKLRSDAGRPCYTFDRTNQFLAQITNDWRSNKPAITILPVDSGADKWTAQTLNGLIKHIEYTSRADQARDTAIEHSARIGLGWTRIVPEVVRPETNEQEILLKRVHDPFSCLLDAASVDPDGQDAMHGFTTSRWRRDKLKKLFPKAKTKGMDGWPTEDAELWGDDDYLTVLEYFYIVEKACKYLRFQMPDGSMRSLKADEFDQEEARLGFRPMVLQQFETMERKQTWCKMTGAEVLEETEFPCRWVPLIPYYGDEMWLEGKRYLSGMVRKLMPSQRAYNMERSSAIEFVALQPKAPFMVPFEGIEAHEDHWAKLNTGAPSYLPFNHKDEQGNLIPMPQRIMPPPMPAAYATLGMQASQDMEAAAGMHKANLGQSGNETSGRAILARKSEGDAATFHYQDNGMRSVSHEARIILDMIPRIYDQPRTARIIGEDGKNDFVQMKPGIGPAQREGKKVIAIDPTAGQYDVRVTAGASHATQREEAAFGMEQMINGPSGQVLGPILAPALLKLRDFPDADKLARGLSAMLPPEVKAAMDDDEDEQEPIPPKAMAMIQKLQAENQQMAQMLDAAEAEMAKVEAERQKVANDTTRVQIEREMAMLDKQLQAEKITISQYQAETARLKVVADTEDKHMARAQADEVKQAEDDKEERTEEVENTALTAIAQAVQSLAEQQAGTAQMLQAMMEANQSMQAGMQEMTAAATAPRVKQAQAMKVDGKWVLTSTETVQ